MGKHSKGAMCDAQVEGFEPELVPIEVPVDEEPQESEGPAEPEYPHDEFAPRDDYQPTGAFERVADGDAQAESADDLTEAGAPANDEPELVPIDVPDTAADDAPAPAAPASVASLSGKFERTPEEAQQIARYTRENARSHYTSSHSRSGFSKKQKRALAIVVAIVAVLSIFAGSALAFFQDAQRNTGIDDADLEATLTVPDPQAPYWTLILGSDKRPQESSTDPTRSDVIMLARIDETAKQVTLVSIPRDSKVYIEGQGMQKINAAYAFGGAALAVDTVEKYAGVQISHYAEIYFDGFKDLVDDLGGVTVDVPERASYAGVTIEPGLQTLDGEQALTLARNRKTYSEGDFTRTKCQRLLAQALAEKVLSRDLTQLPATVESLSKCFSTDIPLGDVVGIALKLQGMPKDNVYMGMAPSTTGMVDGVSYTFTYINQWKLLMQRAAAGEKPKVNKRETEICGYASTQYEDMDMSTGLPEDVQEQLDAYWAEKARKKAEKEAARNAATGESSTVDGAVSGDSTTAKTAGQAGN